MGAIAATRPAPLRARGADGLRGFPPVLLIAIAAALAARIAYWAVTGHRFDDALITVTHARNVALGLGLTHHPGEGRVHGFTSAVSVLVPLAGELVKLGAGFVALRLASLAAAAVTMVYAYRLAGTLGLNRWATGFVLAYLAFDYNNILYGMAGMETQIAVAVLLAGAYYLLQRDTVKVGVSLGIALLTRPDFALWVAPALLALFLWQRRAALRAGLITAGIIAPWLLFTIIYYGSPVPNTIRAKQQAYTEHPAIGHTPASVVHFIQAQLHQHQDQWRYLAPFRENFAVARAPVDNVWLLLVAIGVIALASLGAWVTRRVPMWWPVLAYVGLFATYKLLLLPPTYYEWYLPPFMAFVVLLTGAGITRLARSMPRVAPALAVALALLFAWQTVPLTLIDRKVQNLENHVREPVGEDLRAMVRPGEAVTSESAGYIGFYSHAKLYDYPGLTSPTARDALARLGRKGNNLFALVDALRPRWVVLRRAELDQFRAVTPGAAAAYDAVKRVAYAPPGSRPAGTGITFDVGGVVYHDSDQDFTILRRRD